MALCHCFALYLVQELRCEAWKKRRLYPGAMVDIADIVDMVDMEDLDLILTLTLGGLGVPGGGWTFQEKICKNKDPWCIFFAKLGKREMVRIFRSCWWFGIPSDWFHLSSLHESNSPWILKRSNSIQPTPSRNSSENIHKVFSKKLPKELPKELQAPNLNY